jgi:hypothetical protein
VPYKYAADQRRAAERHYAAHKAEMVDRAKKHNRRQRKTVKAYIHRAKDVPCADCGIRYPYYVMQFDHVRGVKLFNIGDYTGGGAISMKRIRAEIAKCDVVCANCHAERTYQRGYYTDGAPSAEPDDAPVGELVPTLF